MGGREREKKREGEGGREEGGREEREGEGEKHLSVLLISQARVQFKVRMLSNLYVHHESVFFPENYIFSLFLSYSRDNSSTSSLPSSHKTRVSPHF